MDVNQNGPALPVLSQLYAQYINEHAHLKQELLIVDLS